MKHVLSAEDFSGAGVGAAFGEDFLHFGGAVHDMIEVGAGKLVGR